MKIVRRLLCLFLTMSCLSFYPVLAQEEKIDYLLAEESMSTFIYDNSQDNLAWNNMIIVGSEPIFDVTLEQIGIVFNLSSGFQEGYGIVIKMNEQYIVIEASKETKTPFDYSINGKNVYPTPLFYLIAPESNNRGTQEFIDISTGISISLNSINQNNFNFQVEQMTRGATTTTQYLGSYQQFEKISQQPNGYACVPASFSMALKYMHNRGMISLSYSGTNAQMKDKLFDLMKNDQGRVMDQGLKDGLENFTRTYSNRMIKTKTDTYQPNCNFSTAKAEINSSFPVIINFRAGTMYQDYNHACTMVGYKIIDNGSSSVNYAIVIDPLPTSSVEKTIAWSTNWMLGYYILYRS